MGYWGIKTFENDSAQDWIFGLEEEKNLAIVALKFGELFSTYHANKKVLIDDDLASQALAAAEIVSALLGKPSFALPPTLKKWLEKNKTYSKELVSVFNELAKTNALENKSETLWKDCTKAQKWNLILDSLSEYAVASIDLVLDHSELTELWKESADYERWIQEVKNLRYRCSLTSSKK